MISTVSSQVAEVSFTGPFDLDASTRFLEGFTPAARPDAAAEPGVLRMAFPVERTWSHAGVVVRQRAPDRVEVEVFAEPDVVPFAVTQVRRMLSLDVDGEGFARVGAADKVVAGLQERNPGLRPVLFHSPYEAACWAVIGHGIRIVQAAGIKRRVAERFGREVDVGGVPLISFPTPEELLEMDSHPSLPPAKVERLHAMARAARDGLLDAETLRAKDSAEALTRLLKLPGIGPFSSQLILIRGAGHPDVFPRDERRLQDEMARVYGQGGAVSAAKLERIADAWRPYRSWVALLFRTEREIRTGEIGGRRS
ncbi:DNA-3-methyladenine glycosylase II [Amycolatopsis xylanica]|uniref:DNA-3-methyladenine glycosylase II n=1 Tax=Amycolatopsis xylanica TaxID=589385 RepID=A0A1H3D0Q0_9PSEU|nr:DNA-3-methyladenine glycosylase [Amycolatopsis xylanica]SDX59971.1 DNA-3-methyladenine glycosylase II [Amycolatopsis xylanica]